MLGTLAIMGMLSVVGLAGYHVAMDKHRANTLIQEAQKRAVIVAGQIAFGQNVSLAEFTENTFAGGTFGEVKTKGLTGQFGIEISGVKKRICENILQTIGDSTPIRRFSKENTPTTAITNCEDDNSFLIIYNNDMTANDVVESPRACRKASDCKSACANCDIPEGEEVGICTNECEEPVKLCEKNTDCNTKNECMVCDIEAGLCKNGCERVEYLRSKNGQYINTKVKVGQSVMKVELSLSEASNFLFGCGNLGSAGNGIAFGENSGRWSMIFPAYNMNLFGTATTELVDFTWVIDGITATISGYASKTASHATALGPNAGWRQNDLRFPHGGSGKFYNIKLYKDNVLVRDFVPVHAPFQPEGKQNCMLNMVPEDKKLKLYCSETGVDFDIPSASN